MSENERQTAEMQPATMADDNQGGCGTPLPLELQGAIGQKLKIVYGQMLLEPLPDKFSQLLAQLGKADKD